MRKAAREPSTAASSSSSIPKLLTSLGAEQALLLRILRVSQLQHGHGIYYHRLRDAHKRLRAATERCAPDALEVAGGHATARAAIERALDAIPSPWLKLRHLLAQTYFMPLALSCLSLLSRAATLLATVHTALGGADGAATRRLPKLLRLAQPQPQDVLGRFFGDAAAPEGDVSIAQPAEQPPPDADEEPAAAMDADDDLGEIVRPDDADVSDLFYTDPLPAAPAVAPATAALSEHASESAPLAAPPAVRQPQQPVMPPAPRRRRADARAMRGSAAGGGIDRSSVRGGYRELLALGSLLHAHGVSVARSDRRRGSARGAERPRSASP